MLFNSLEFAVFFALFYNFYLHFQRDHRAQNWLLLAGSYLFYGWWDWRFLSLLLLSTVIDYLVGRRIARLDAAHPDRPIADPSRKRWVLVSLVSNLGILGLFKYFDFFTESFAAAAHGLGWQVDALTLDLVLPVGISFYTFQTLSYTIDIYRRRLDATEDLLDFAVYVAFFPKLVAGPIERAQTFLPQVARPRTIEAGQVESGIWLIAWGLFKKVVIADNVARVANAVFNDYPSHQGLDLVLGALAFTVQIYGDFSGYSDIARGLAKLMGFELMVNFSLPYVSRTPSEFWRRWHISLSSWLRDYLYISLGGNRGARWKLYRNLMLTMLLGGLWHGAAWNFVLWGLFHGTILCLYRPIEQRLPPVTSRPLRAVGAFGAWALFFILTVVGWILFRAHSVEQIGHFLTHMWSGARSHHTASYARTVAWCAAPLVVAQVAQYLRHDLLAPIRGPLVWRAALCALLIAALPLFAPGEAVEFIYFQF